VYSVAFYMDHDQARRCLAPFKQLGVYEMRENKRLTQGERPLHILVIFRWRALSAMTARTWHSRYAGPCTVLLLKFHEVHVIFQDPARITIIKQH
jgi:hypothetical protein